MMADAARQIVIFSLPHAYSSIREPGRFGIMADACILSMIANTQVLAKLRRKLAEQSAV